MPVSISGTNGVTFPDSSLQTAAASPYVLKNRIINGAFDVWQRGTSITGSTSSSSASYWADRWCYFRSANPTAITLSQQTTSPPSGFKNFARIQRTASNTSTEAVYINQSEEILNSYDLAGQQVTLSFWARAGANYSPASSLINVVVTTGTGSTDNNSLWNSWTGVTYPINTTTTLTTSWQKFTFTGSVGSSVTQIAAQFYFTPVGTAGANDYLDITGVQLEQNTSATPFERRLYNQELANCQRYYEVGTDRNAIMWSGQTAASVASFYSNKGFCVTKRASPTVTTSNEVVNGFASGSPGLNIDSTGIQAFRNSNGSAVVSAYWFYNWTASIEL